MIKTLIGSMVGRIMIFAAVAALVSAVTYHFYTLGVQTRKTEIALKQRDEERTWITNICSSVAVPPQSKPELYKPACQETIRRLFNFHASATSETTKALVRAEQERVQRLEEDNRIRMQNERNLTLQLRRLREISVNVKEDQVGPDYWAAINRVAGLPAPSGQAGGVNPGSTSDSSGHVSPEVPAAGTAELQPPT